MTEFTARSLINLCGILIVGYMSQHNDLFGERRRKAYFYAVGTVALSMIAELLSVGFAQPNSLHRGINMTACVIGFSLSPIIPLLLANGFSDEGFRLNRALMLPSVVNLLLVFLSPVYGFIFDISASNDYARGSLFTFYVCAYLFGIVIFLLCALKVISVYQNGNRIVLFGLVGVTLLGTTFQLVWPEMLVSWSTMAIVIILGYAYHVELLDKHDVLTSLLNRRAYEQHLLQMERSGGGVVILFDIDDFKLINDRHGHQYGDECLRALAGIIRSSYAKIGYSYRIGGDEFAVLGKCEGEDAINATNREFLHNIEMARRKDPRLPWVSPGYAMYHSSLGIDQVVESADRQLFAYKRERKRDAY